MTNYTKEFYDCIDTAAINSAKEVIPLILKLIQPKSVIDVGCGTGKWLSIFQEQGIQDLLGVDGSYIDQDALTISKQQFLSYDLSHPLVLEREFDLVMSLEVAEHLPQENAEAFITSLTNLSKVVLFSAAIPHQPGTDHINCQWLDYWAQLFFAKGYVLLDCFRLNFWQNANVEWWYAQNMVLFVQQQSLQDYPALQAYPCYKHSVPPVLVHPQLYLLQQRRNLLEQELRERSLKQAVKHLIHAIYYRLVPTPLKFDL
jgi:SAM-dependent methyltransferase